MATNPRDTEDVVDALSRTWNDIDPTLDTQKGPIAVVGLGVSSEISRTETMTAYLTTVYQLENADSIDETDLEALGNNYGLDPYVGSAAQVVVTLYRESRPQAGMYYRASEGDLVGTDDGRYIYSLTQDILMDGDNPDIYYNPDERRYEINVKAEAVSVGDDFNLPENTIRSLISGITDFDGVTNKNTARSGADPITPTQFRNFIWNNLQGLNADMLGAMMASVIATDPIYTTDAAFVSSTDLSLFERLKETNGRTAFDVYVMTDNFTEDMQSYTAIGGEQYIDLERKPVQSIQYVTVDGVSVPFRLQKDTTQAYRNSPLAEDKVYLDGTVLQPGQTVDIRYFYFESVFAAWQEISSRTKPFGNDVLVRLPYPVTVFVGARLAVTSTNDRDQVIGSIWDQTEAYFRDPSLPSAYRRRFIYTLDPREYQDNILQTVPGIASFTVTDFARMDQAVQDISVIEFNGRNEYPVLSPQSAIL